MEIVTGFQGKNHVTARQISRLLRGALGPGTYVLDTLDQLAAEVLTANTVRVGTGDVVIDGTFYTNEAPEELIIENGVTGLNRNDLIVCRYTKAEPSVDEEGNVDYTIPRIEDGVLAVVKGTPTSGTPVDPELHSASVYDENTNLSEEALYRIPITGLSVGEPVPLFQKFTPAQEFRDSLSRSIETYANGSVCVTVNPASRTAIASIVGMQLSSSTTASVSISLPAEYAPTIEVDAPIVDTNAGRVGWAWVSNGGTTIKAHAPSSPSGSAWYGQLAWHF